MYLRVSVTDRCNLRCVYCLPADARFAATRASTIDLQHLTRLVVEAAGVSKIRITGGEPTVCDDVVEHVRHARGLVPTVGITSNGILLEPLLPALREAGLSRINISLDALDAELFRRFSRRDGLASVVASIRTAKRLGFTPVKVNAVAMQATDFAALVRFAAWEGVHVRFIELMAIGEALPWQAKQYLAASTMRERIAAAGITLHERTDHDEPTSRVWSIDERAVEDCSVGFITTTSAPFCATCNRLRLTSQGVLHTCLMDDQGYDLLATLNRSGPDAVRSLVRLAVSRKRPPETFVRHGVMAAIGG